MKPHKIQVHGTKKLLNRSVQLMETVVWVLFFVSLPVVFFPTQLNRMLSIEPYLVVTGLTRVTWPYVTVLTGIVLNFSKRYMSGNHRIGYFFLRCVFFLCSVMVLTATNHFVVFLAAWLSMGWFMSRLIAHKIDWPQARAAGHMAFRYFLAGTLFLSIGFFVSYEATNSLLIPELMNRLNTLSSVQFTGALIQSALFPVQSWLMSSMTAPTPASALMHAGFVNAGGVLLTKFAPLFTFKLTPMLIICTVGALSAITGKIWKMVQTAVKRQLGCSTIAQMGFMILQCGLGYFSAAISHLILHGFYKGYLFLNSGNAVEQTHPGSGSDDSSGMMRNLVSLGTGLVGGGIFIAITGKGLQLNSGLFLVFVVVLTLLHGSREILNEISVSGWFRHTVFPAVALSMTVIYSFVFNGITWMMSDLPKVVSPTAFTYLHILILAGFLGSWIFVEAKWYRRFDRLYVHTLNASQPDPNTVLSSKEEYHV